MNFSRPEMADIVRAHHRDLLARWSHVLSREQRKALATLASEPPARSRLSLQRERGESPGSTITPPPS